MGWGRTHQFFAASIPVRDTVEHVWVPDKYILGLLIAASWLRMLSDYFGVACMFRLFACARAAFMSRLTSFVISYFALFLISTSLEFKSGITDGMRDVGNDMRRC